MEEIKEALEDLMNNYEPQPYVMFCNKEMLKNLRKDVENLPEGLYKVTILIEK